MKRVYVRMFIGLLVSAFCALGVASSQAALNFVFGNSIMRWGILIAMFAMAFIIPARLNKMASGTVLVLFLVFSALMGTWLSAIFLVYQMNAIVATFFITAGTFGAMSVYGYFTKSDLTKMGSFLMMALFGLIIAMVVNIFLKSGTMDYVISIIGVLIFTGLTAWDTQQVKQLAAANLEPSLADKLATMGAMNLYLDFINLFLFILRIFGGNRD
ncbi:MAG: Bax inhibitor-1/YccA family protein [Muribaculaceae bacterium]|nr:Bax inhibitor-1/YccA family protein [Muribaculaceae bacterium]